MTDNTNPSNAGGNGGRGPDGRFAPGNKAGKGNPHAKRAHRLRAALMKAVTPADIRAVIAKLLEMAIGGDVQAAKLILDRTLGPAVPWDYEERLSELETAVKGPADVT